jgi:hypothetical protein
VIGMTWEFTQELEDRILENLENGISLVKICQMEGMPSRSTVLRWQRDMPEFDAKCARAREAQGEYAAEKMDDINDKVEAGILDPAAARVISSNLQWKASKLFSKRYGEKLNLGGQDDNPIKADISHVPDKEVARRLAFLLAKATLSDT